jgi:hypothetical protein
VLWLSVDQRAMSLSNGRSTLHRRCDVTNTGGSTVRIFLVEIRLINSDKSYNLEEPEIFLNTKKGLKDTESLARNQRAPSDHS